MKKEIKEKDDTITDLNKMLEMSKDSVSQLQEQQLIIVERDRKIGSLTISLQEMQERYRVQEEELAKEKEFRAAADQKVMIQQQHLDALKMEIEKSAVALEQANQTIKQLKDCINAEKSGGADVLKRLQESDTKIDTLTKEIEALRQTKLEIETAL